MTGVERHIARGRMYPEAVVLDDPVPKEDRTAYDSLVVSGNQSIDEFLHHPALRPSNAKGYVGAYDTPRVYAMVLFPMWTWLYYVDVSKKALVALDPEQLELGKRIARSMIDSAVKDRALGEAVWSAHLLVDDRLTVHMRRNMMLQFMQSQVHP